MRIRIRAVLLSLAALLIVVAIALGLWLRGSLPDFRGSLRVPGIEAPVNIIRDANAVPHIFAARELDAYYALGFVHAGDRLWQMDLMRRLAAGRLSEIFGEPALSTDKLMRTLGLHALAGQAAEQVTPAVRNALDAYAAGVNAWLDHGEQSLPPEFLALRYRPEEWQPADSLAWGKLMAWQLAGDMRQEILRARLAEILPPKSVDQLLPSGIGQTEEQRAAQAQTSAAPSPTLSGQQARAFLDLLGPGFDRASASNVWAIGPERTATGGAILANDPHLGLSVPIPWYLARIESPKLAVRGATVPGVPFMVLGHNRHIAWGITNTGADVQDLLIVGLDSEDATVVHTPDGPSPVTSRVERIDVRGGDAVALTVRDTPFGPIISDLLDSVDGLADEGKAIVLAFTALVAEDPTSASLFAINHAADWPEVQQAVADWVAPPVNLAYADVEGRIAFAVIGNIPKRLPGDGMAPAQRGPWRDYIAKDDMPADHRPAKGWIGNANSDPSPPGYPHWLASGFEESYRQQRLEQLIGPIEDHALADSLSAQADTVSLAALDLLPLMMAINPQDPVEADLFADLRLWDGSMDRDRSEPLVFVHWFRELTRVLFEDELGEAIDRYQALRPSVIRAVLTDYQGWCDDTQTEAQETCHDALRLSLRHTLLRLEESHGSNRSDWRWGNEHVAALAHPLFSRIPMLGWLGDLSRATDGGPFTLNRGDTPVWNDEAPFRHTHGAGFRAVYDLANLDQSRFIIATGPSGNPLSAYYGSMVDQWRDGESVLLSGSPEDLSQSGLGLFTLRPDID